MKNFFNIIIIIFLLTGLYKIFFDQGPDLDASLQPPQKVEIQTYSSSTKNVEEVFKQVESPKKAPLADVKEQKEVPKEESLPKERADNSIQGRSVLGMDFMPVQILPSEYTFENDINPNWKSLAIKEFIDDDDDLSRVEVDHLESQIFLREGIALYIEKVKIRVSELDGLGGEFMAYVDSSTGEVLHAWDPGAKPFDDPALAEPSLDEFEDYNNVPYEENDEISTNSLDN